MISELSTTKYGWMFPCTLQGTSRKKIILVKSLINEPIAYPLQ